MATFLLGVKKWMVNSWDTFRQKSPDELEIEGWSSWNGLIE